MKPSSGPAGSAFTIGWAGFYKCRIINFTWAGTLLTSKVAPADSGSVGVNVPATAKPGSYTVTATCTSQPETASGTFRVPAIVTPTTPPPPVTTKPPVTTTPPKTTPTKPSVTTPTTTTSSSSATPTSETPVTSETPTTTTTPADGVLVLDHPSIQPGDTLSATGNGCEPGHSVTLTSNGDKVGSTVADATGHFKSPVEFTRIEAGTHTVTADCGIKLTGAVEQVVTSSSGGHTGTLVLLVFFVLAGAAAIRVP
ncbi:hypothetical protein [Amycolatopsis sp. NPDC059657]|uniref:hypothetical protein n=1 Tax=Amycolatopsis sp. NPDC059657 TaxID=3346899 RepID=UPI003671C81D